MAISKNVSRRTCFHRKSAVVDSADWDLVFPDDEKDANPATHKFFQAAQAWAAQRTELGGGGLSYDMPDSDEDDDDDVGDDDNVASDDEGAPPRGSNDGGNRVEEMDQDE